MKKRRWLDALVVQAGISAALSFSHIHDVAAAAGQGAWQSWCYPISVDLLLFAAWQRLRRGEGGKQEWFWFIVALLVSLGANLSHVGLMDPGAQPSQVLALVVAGWPAVAFLGGTLLVHGRKKTPEPEPVIVEEVPAIVEEVVPVPVVSEPEPVSDPVLEEEYGYDEPEPVRVPILEELEKPVHVPDITEPEHWDAPREKKPPRMKSWSTDE